MRIESAFILAAGIGEKLKPFTETLPKPSIPIGNKPIIRHIVETVKQFGINNIYLIVPPEHSQIKKDLRGLEEVEFIIQNKPLGTAHALKTALEEVRKDIEDRWLVVYGDIVSAKENYEIILNEASKRRGECVVLATKLNRERPNDWICCRVREKRIEQIIAHPRHSVSHRLVGIYVLSEKIIPYLEITPEFMSHIPVGVMPPKEYFLEESMAMMIDDGEEILAVEPSNFIVDVDKPWHILEANKEYLKYIGERLEKDLIDPEAEVSERAEIYGHIVIGKNSKIGPNTVIRGNAFIGANANIEHCIIGENVVIGDYARIGEYCKIWPQTSIGKRTRILHLAEVEGVIMDGVSVMHHAMIYGVIGRFTDIAAGTVVGNLRFDDNPPRMRIRKRREFPPRIASAAYIGDYCRTGVNSMIMPGVRIGPYSIVGPGVIVYKDVPPRKLILPKQELEIRDWGPEIYGW
ncbi:MAG: sugar phosphate nucleotidyltransferase [Candidatus Njordarchaeales archaeon]